MDQHIIRPSDWAETFQYLSREVLSPEAFATEMLQQVPTPPASDILSPYPEGTTTVVSVSTVFFPGAELGQPHPPDLTLHTSDSVCFCVHTMVLLRLSKNSFNSLLPPYPCSPASDDGSQPTINVPEDSHVLNVVLHALYMIPCVQFCPLPDVTSRALHALKRYGISLKPLAVHGTCLYDLVLSRAPLHPIEFYAISAEHGLEDLAVAISSHLMSFNLANLTDEIAIQIGPTYLKRLFFLHLGRNDALKRLVFTPPMLHGPTPLCDFTEQKKLTRAWALAAAYLAWDARPDLSTSTINSTLGSLQEHLSCQLCRDHLKQRVKQIIIEWSNVKKTI